MTKQQTIDVLKTQLPGFYSVEQVIDLVTKIESSEATGGFTKEQVLLLVDRLINEVEENVNNLDSDCIDKSTAEFSLNYNEVELDSVDFDTSDVRDAVINGLRDVAETFFEELEKEDKED